MKRTVLFMITTLVLAVLVMAIGGTGSSQAQQPPSTPTATNSADPGTVDLSWSTLPGVANYTVGWLANDDYVANPDNNEWLKYFAYSNVGEVQEWTLRRLSSGIDYWFIVCGNLSSDPVVCTSWTRLTITELPTTSCPTQAAQPIPMGGAGDYDSDDDGLIEIRNLDQLNAIRYDLDGDGSTVLPAYSDAFPDARTDMGCPSDGCTGYELATDLDLDTNGNGRFDSADAYWNGGAGWTPIGSNEGGFRATFEGNDRTIDDLHTEQASAYVGLFGYIESEGIIRNLGLVGGEVSGTDNVGGLAGYNEGAISNSYTTGDISNSGDHLGGLVGQNEGAISDSHATGDVSSSGHEFGGLVGTNLRDGAVSDSYATGNVTGVHDVSDSVGGLLGQNFGDIANSYATGDVYGDGYVGGLVGRQDSGSIVSSHATGDVTGDWSSWTGRLVGYHNGGTITDSSGTGMLTIY